MPAFLNYFMSYPPETWTGDGAVVLENLVSVLDQNPFHPFEEMNFNDRDAWPPYDKAQALAYLKRGSRTTASFRAHKPFYLQGGVAQFRKDNTATFRVSEQYMAESGMQAAGALLRQLAPPLAQPWRGWCKVDSHSTRIADLYAEHKLYTLPDCFGSYLGWRHILSPAGYAPYFERQALLQAPAWSVQEDAQGLIELVIYADPLSYGSPQSQQFIIDVTRYLNAHRRSDS